MSNRENINNVRSLDISMTVDYLAAIAGYGGTVVTAAGALASAIEKNPQMVQASLDTALEFFVFAGIASLQWLRNRHNLSI